MNTSITDKLRKLSVQDFQAFGVGHLSYVKPVSVEARTAFGLYSAEGKLLTLQDRPEIALLVARNNGLEPLTLH